MYKLRLIRRFIQLSTQNEMAYRANFFIGLLHTLLNFGTGILGIMVLFGQIETIQGWDFNTTLAILGVYLTGAIRGLFISSSLDALAGLGGEIWTGRFDFTLLRPVDVQFLVSFRHWRPLVLFDLILGLGTLTIAVSRLDRTLSTGQALSFLITLTAGMIILYSILLAFATLVFFSPGFLFTWVFNGVFQMGRYPVGIYPGWMRRILTWVIPVGVITTVPAQALTGDLYTETLLAGTLFAAILFAGASFLFRRTLWRYSSASS